MRPADALIEKQ